MNVRRKPRLSYSAYVLNSGFINDETPELGIAVSPEHRGKGVGAALIKRLLEAAESLYPAIVLSVSPKNRAIGLYERLGFEKVDVRETFPVMIRKLRVK